MLRKNTSRREFLAAAGVAAAGVLAGRAGASPQPMRLGGPIFVESGDPAVLAKAHRDLGYRAAYAPHDLSLTETDRIAGLVKEFARQDVVIAEVGAWKNMLDPDPEKRRSNVTYVTEKLALAELLGARKLRRHRRFLRSQRLVRRKPQKSQPGVFRRHGGKLPQAD